MGKNRNVVWTRLLAMFLIMCMLLTQEQMIVFGAENSEVDEVIDVKTATVSSGTLGDNAGFKWTYNAESKMLTVTGEDTLLNNAIPFTSPFSDIEKEYGTILTIVFENCIFKDSICFLMYRMTALKKVEFINCDTSQVTDMQGMFGYCSNLQNVDLKDVSTMNVENMSNMFDGCVNLEKLDVSHFDTSNVTSMGGMFQQCEKLTTLNVSKFNTKNVRFMDFMFKGCSALKELDVSHFDTSNVGNMKSMFSGCQSLKKLDVSHFNTSNVIDMCEMFGHCDSLKSLDVSHFDTSNVEDMFYMFNSCRNITSLDLRAFNTSKVTNMAGMFMQCVNLSSLDIRSFDMSKIKYIDGMFLWCEQLEKICTPAMLCNGISIILPGTFVDKSGNAVTEITSKYCNTILTRTVNYTISYELNGGKNNSKNPTTYKKTSDTIVLKDATQKGYDFAGWYSDADFKTKVTKIKKGSTGNITLYAKWEPHKYNIKFNGNGADSGSMKTLSNRKYGIFYTLKANAFKKKGYTFEGWNTKKDGSGKAYKNKASVKNLTSTNGKTITLYAQWKKTKYTITYVLKDGGKNNSKNPTYYYITSSSITLKKPTRKGYTFKGWYSDSKYKNKVTKIKKGSTGNKTFYAKWEAHKYHIAFDGNGATSGKMEKLKARSYGKTYKLPANKFKKKGYTFVGWNTKENGTGKSYKNKESVKNLAATNGKTITLYAQWERTKYKISYELYGGTNHSKNPETYTSVSSKITLRSPKREGYQFVAWHTSDKFTKKNIVKVIEKGSKGNKKFYAEWKANKYTIVFDGNGADSGSMENMNNCKYDEVYTLTKNAFAKTGCEFLGWNTKADGSGIAYENAASVKNLSKKNNGKVTLYAQWEESKLLKLRKESEGKYWNHKVNNSSDYGDVLAAKWDNRYANTFTLSPCTNHGISAPAFGTYDCNAFNGKLQCKGFASMVAYLMYGSDPIEEWNKGDISTIKPGDVLVYHDKDTDAKWGHTVFVLAVEGDMITIVEANYGNTCLVKWGRTLDKKYIKKTVVYSAPKELTAKWY